MNKLYYIILILFIPFLTGQIFDSSTGKLIQDSTKVWFKYDPETGLPIDLKDNLKQPQGQPKVDKTIFIGFSDFEVIEKAKKDAENDFTEIIWTAGGGPGSIWASFTLGSLAEIFSDNLIMPTLVGSLYYMPHFISKINVKIPYYHKLYSKENFSNLQVRLYENEYKKEIKNLRLNAIRKGQYGTAGLCVGFIFFLIIASSF